MTCMHVIKSKEKGFFDIQILPDSISASPFPTPSTPLASRPPCLTTFQNLPPPLTCM